VLSYSKVLSVLFFVVLKAVEELVEQRKDYVVCQRLLKEAGSEIDFLKEQVAELTRVEVR